MAFPAIIAGALRALAASGVRAAGAATARGAATAATRTAATLGTRVAAPQVMAAAAQAGPATIASTQATAFTRLLANQQAAQAAPPAMAAPPSLPGPANAPSGMPTPIAAMRGMYQGGAGAMAMGGQGTDLLNRFSHSLTTARDAIDRFANSASRSAQSLRTFDAGASNQTAIGERGRLIRQFERAAMVGPSAVAAARAGEGFEQRAAPIKNLFETLGNVISYATARAFDGAISKLRLDQIANKAIEWLNTLPGIKIEAPAGNPGGHVLPWLNMLNQLAALQPLGAAAGGLPPLPPLNPRP